MSELQSEAVPEEVRKWLASTFAKQETAPRRSAERPSFRSVANAIRFFYFLAWIFCFFSKMVCLQNWNFYRENLSSDVEFATDDDPTRGATRPQGIILMFTSLQLRHSLIVSRD